MIFTDYGLDLGLIISVSVCVCVSLPQSQSVISVHLGGGVSNQERTVSCVSQLLVHLLSTNTEITDDVISQ